MHMCHPKEKPHLFSLFILLLATRWPLEAAGVKQWDWGVPACSQIHQHAWTTKSVIVCVRVMHTVCAGWVFLFFWWCLVWTVLVSALLSLCSVFVSICLFGFEHFGLLWTPFILYKGENVTISFNLGSPPRWQPGTLNTWDSPYLLFYFILFIYLFIVEPKKMRAETSWRGSCTPLKHLKFSEPILFLLKHFIYHPRKSCSLWIFHTDKYFIFCVTRILLKLHKRILNRLVCLFFCSLTRNVSLEVTQKIQGSN